MNASDESAHAVLDRAVDELIGEIGRANLLVIATASLGVAVAYVGSRYRLVVSRPVTAWTVLAAIVALGSINAWSAMRLKSTCDVVGDLGNDVFAADRSMEYWLEGTRRAINEVERRDRPAFLGTKQAVVFRGDSSHIAVDYRLTLGNWCRLAITAGLALLVGIALGRIRTASHQPRIYSTLGWFAAALLFACSAWHSWSISMLVTAGELDRLANH